MHLDITSILLSADLDILELVLTTFRPLRIPQQLIPALTRMRDRIAHHQPSLIEAIRQVLQAIERESIAVEHCSSKFHDASSLTDLVGAEWASLFEASRRGNGYLVDFLPVGHRDPLSSPPRLPDEVVRRVVNCRTVVDALGQHGPLGKEGHARALRELGEEGSQPPAMVMPEPGAVLYCNSGVLDLLAGTGVLDAVCRHFGVVVDNAELDRLRAEVGGHEQRIELVHWLDDVTLKVNRCIEDGTIEVMPIQKVDDEQMLDSNLEVQCLESLLRFAAQPGDVVWVDDRYVNGYGNQGSAPIVGINDVLKALVAAGKLVHAEYFEKMHLLRLSNARFVPVEKEDVLYHLVGHAATNWGSTGTGASHQPSIVGS